MLKLRPLPFDIKPPFTSMYALNSFWRIWSNGTLNHKSSCSNAPGLNLTMKSGVYMCSRKRLRFFPCEFTKSTGPESLIGSGWYSKSDTSPNSTASHSQASMSSSSRESTSIFLEWIRSTASNCCLLFFPMPVFTGTRKSFFQALQQPVDVPVQFCRAGFEFWKSAQPRLARHAG